MRSPGRIHATFSPASSASEPNRLPGNLSMRGLERCRTLQLSPPRQRQCYTLSTQSAGGAAHRRLTAVPRGRRPVQVHSNAHCCAATWRPAQHSCVCTESPQTGEHQVPVCMCRFRLLATFAVLCVILPLH